MQSHGGGLMSSQTTSPPELRTHRAIGLPTEYTVPVEAAKEYMRSSGLYFTRQHSRRFIAAVKDAWDAVKLDASVKGKREDPTGWEAVRRVLSQQERNDPQRYQR